MSKSRPLAKALALAGGLQMFCGLCMAQVTLNDLVQSAKRMKELELQGGVVASSPAGSVQAIPAAPVPLPMVWSLHAIHRHYTVVLVVGSRVYALDSGHLPAHAGEWIVRGINDDGVIVTRKGQRGERQWVPAPAAGSAAEPFLSMLSNEAAEGDAAEPAMASRASLAIHPFKPPEAVRPEAREAAARLPLPGRREASSATAKAASREIR